MPGAFSFYRAIMEIFSNKKVAIPLVAGLGILAILGAWWGISRLPPSGGIQTTSVKGEAALQAGAAADTELLSQMSIDDLKAAIQSRKMAYEAAMSYKIDGDIKMTKEALERAEAVLKTK